MQPPSQLSNMDWGNWGKYPKNFDPSIHGRFDPAKYYGKADVPFGEVKLGELGSWFARREKGPIRLAQMIGRAYWRWQHKYVLPKKCGVAPFFQMTVTAMIFFYVINYPKLRWHANYKYH
ncbi:putative ATP synthase subunit f, mitochondrial [Diachasma alloeum]|uniref:F chain, ATP synthase n=1 Tax=Diachasma alloeum TaxID=454923 RepID=A0A4E0RMD7_9HYME|nr:putative ATP synthase subunit f, mitochondrial [Diachasma alloeum]THK32918.1 F chain, ATP synthase [Diachasma alloeum]